jgi:hypothetical protein
MRTVPTFTATIYVGRYNRDTGEMADKRIADEAIQGYVDLVGLCVSVTETEFRYTNGNEPGLIIGLINYPRFPSTPELITRHAIALAMILKDVLKQYRVSIVFADKTIML